MLSRDRDRRDHEYIQARRLGRWEGPRRNRHGDELRRQLVHHRVGIVPHEADEHDDPQPVKPFGSACIDLPRQRVAGVLPHQCRRRDRPAGTGASGEHFCSNAPLACGFADIANTGPPAGTLLQAIPGTYTSPSGPGANRSQTGSGWSCWKGTITRPNSATIKDTSFTGDINISGLRTVAVEDSDITDYNDLGSDSFIIGLHDASSDIKIQNNNLRGLDAVRPGDGCDDAVRDFAGNSTNVTIANKNIWFSGASMNNLENADWTIEDNYVHDSAYSCAVAATTSTASSSRTGQRRGAGRA